MAPEKHCWWSPSSAKENILCPARPKMVENAVALQGEQISSKAAQQGTAVHEVMEAYNNTGKLVLDSLEEDWQRQCCRDMVKYQSSLTLSDPDKHVEVKAQLTIAGTKIWGTADLVLTDLNENLLVVMDYKSGIGHPVEVKENAQLMVYALGVIETLGYDLIEPDIMLAINQPRIFKELKTWKLSYADLLDWKAEVLEPAIEQAMKGEPCVPGEVQCRWCAASGNMCGAEKQAVLDLLPEIAKSTNKPEIIDLEPNYIARILSMEKQIQATLKKLKARAIKQAEQGVKFPGLKLVEVVGNKRWTDEQAVGNYLMRHKLSQKERYVTRLVGPTAAEKLLSAKGELTVRTSNWLAKHIARPVTGNTLVPESDPRPEIKTAADDLETENAINIILGGPF